MGVLAAHATNRITQGQRALWSTPAIGSDALSPADLLYLMCVRVLSTIGDLKGVVTDWSGTTGKRTDVQRAMTSSSCILRLEGGIGKGCKFALGTVAPKGAFVADWVMSVTAAGSGDVSIEVPSYRTTDKKLVHGGILTAAREQILWSIGQDHTVEITDGPPAFERLMTVTALAKGSPFAGDFVTALPPAFADKMTISLGSGQNELLASKFRQCGVVLRDHVINTEIDLAPGIEQDTRLALLESPTGMWLRLSAPGINERSVVGQQRAFRSFVRTLRFFAIQLEAGSPARTRLDAALTELLQGSVAQDRIDDFVPLWNERLPSAAVPLARNTGLPLGLIVTSTAAMSFDQVVEAERGLLLRQRSWAKGLRQKTRDDTRTYSARRPAALSSKDGGMAPYLRYLSMAETDIERFFHVDVSHGWFWEVHFRKLPPVDGRHQCLLFADGLSTADGCLAYGPELMTLFRSWAAIILAKDPAARIQTISVRL